MTDRHHSTISDPNDVAAGRHAPDGARRLWFLQQLNGDTRAYHIIESYHVVGPLDREALGRALVALADRHDSLRTVLRDGPDGPVTVADGIRPAVPVLETPADLLLDGCGDPAAELLRQEWDRPFDLATGPLLRARLLSLADDEHVLCLTIHHIASDGWSQLVLRRDLGALYSAFATGGPGPAGPAPRFADAVSLLRADAASPLAQTDLIYWRERLAGLDDRPWLPADRPRGTAAETTPVHRVPLDPELATRLRRIAAAHGATLSMALAAGLFALLSRYTVRTDLAVGTPVAGRRHTALEQTVGFLADTLVLRVPVGPEVNFAGLLHETRAALLQGLDHQTATFEHVVQHAAPRRQSDRTPLFQVLFGHQTVSEEPLRLQGLQVRPLDLTLARSRFDLEMHAFERPGGTDLLWTYDGSLFDPWRIRQLAVQYTALLDRVTAEPDLAIGRVPLPGAAEPVPRPRAAATADTVAGTGSDARNAYAPFARRVQLHPDAPALNDGTLRLSYRDLDGRAAAFARQLREHGAQPHAIVAIGLPLGVDMVAAVLGALRIGAATVLLPRDEDAGRTAAVMRAADVSLLVTTQEIAVRLPEAARRRTITAADRTGTHSAAEAESDDAMAESPKSAFIAFHGTPGEQLGPITGSHAGLLSAAAWQRDRLALTAVDRVLLTAPRDLPDLLGQLLAPLATGAELVIAGSQESTDPQTLLGRMARLGITVAQLPTALIEAAVSTTGSQAPIPASSALRHLIVTDALPNTAARHAFLAQFPEAKITVALGGAATCGPVGFAAVSDPAASSGHEALQLTLETAVPGTELFVLDAAGHPVPPGAVGTLCMAGLAVAQPVGLGGRASPPAPFAAHPADSKQLLWWSGASARTAADGVVSLVVSSPPDEYGPGHVPSAAIGATRDVNDSTAIVCELFAEVLGLTQISSQDDFFALGGHSLMAMSLLALIQTRLGAELAVRDVFDAPTPALLATMIETAVPRH